jgi:hypothetical protein
MDSRGVLSHFQKKLNQKMCFETQCFFPSVTNSELVKNSELVPLSVNMAVHTSFELKKFSTARPSLGGQQSTCTGILEPKSSSALHEYGGSAP